METEPEDLPETIFDDVVPEVAHKVMVRMALKRGLKTFGVRGEEAVANELLQIYMRDTFTPKKMEDLSNLEHKKALESLLFLEEKQSGKLKGWMCAYGRKQHEVITKKDATSPMVSTDYVLINAVIDAHEHMDVAVIDLPGAYLNVDMDDIVCMVM